MSNFSFLKKENKYLFNIISDAEQLFRDEYFDQVIIQVRRFAENLCRDILDGQVTPDDTFDFMINKIKDNSSFENLRIKEFIEDLYFIKKNGNASAHSVATEKTAENALECMERAFEISIFYSHAKFGFDEKIDKKLFSEELLVTGKMTKKQTISEKYADELQKEREQEKEKVIKALHESSNIEPMQQNDNKKNEHKKTKNKKKEPSIKLKDYDYNYNCDYAPKTNIVKFIFFILLACVMGMVVWAILK